MTCRAQKNVRRLRFERRLRMTVIAVALTVPAIAAQAQQVYKWVDANGRVQYSERKPSDAATRSTEIKPPPPPQPVPAPVPVYRPQPDASGQTVAPPAPRRESSVPLSLSAGLNRESDAYRCALAKDVLSGAVQHANGAPTDAHDRQVAQNDLRLYCK
ncbi:DUF4124 domain-containing protein [Mitsuaria sp. CC2]|jgi:hypothetical protein|uniref:DUF4124 domain-containing protein n=1 Tax=Mitsuaria sp. CC2 TaxID=3029186 RepID=UPI003B8D2104